MLYVPLLLLHYYSTTTLHVALGLLPSRALASEAVR